METTTSTDVGNEYWAAVQDEEAPEGEQTTRRTTSRFGQKLQAKLDACREALNTSSHIQHVATAYTHYFGQDIEGVGADASRVSRAGEQGEVAEVRVPHVRALAAGVVNIITGAKVSWSSLAINRDHKSIAACITSNGALEYYWKDRGVFGKGVQAVLEGVVLGEGFVFSPWDTNLGEPAAGMDGRLIHEGDIAYHNVSTWDVLRDPTYRSWEDLPWVAVVLWRNKYDVAASYPERAKEVLSKPATQGIRWTPFGSVGMEPDCIPVTYYFHKQTPALQRGREAVALDGGLVLEDKPLSKAYWKRLPLYRFAAGELLGSPYPHTSFWDALGVCQVADSVHTSLSTNITTTAPGLISAEDGSELAPDSITGGPKILYRKAGSPAPVAVELQQASQWQFKYLDLLRKEAQQILSLNPTALGTPESANLSGAALAQLCAMAIQNNSDLQGAWVNFVSELGNGTVAHWQNNVKTPRKIAIAGKGRASLVKALELNSEAMANVDRVVVEIGSPLQQTTAGRMELAQLYLQIPGLVKTPEQIQGLVDSGRMDPVTQDLSNQLLCIEDENEMLSEGQQPPVILTDDHRLHIREHPGVGSSKEARSDPKVMQVLQAHIAEHIKVLRETDPAILMAMGQQPIPQAPPPPGMGPPGAPPPDGAPPPPGGPPPGEEGMAPPPGPQDAAAQVSMPQLPVNPQTGERFTPAAGMPAQ